MKRIMMCLIVLVLLCAVGVSAFACKDKKDNAADAGNAPATVEAAGEKLRAAGYEVDVRDVSDDEDYTESGIIGFVHVENEETFFYALLFDDENKAALYYYGDKEDYEEGNEELREDYGKNAVAGRIGKWIYQGLEDIVATFLK